MCGIFGIASSSNITNADLHQLAFHAQQRGKDASGLFFSNGNKYSLYRANAPVTSLLKQVDISSSTFVMGHSRLITNGLLDNQPIYRDSICVIHNGIVVNDQTVWDSISQTRQLEIDTEVIAAISADVLQANGSLLDVANRVLGLCEGVVACAIAFHKLGKMCLFSNNGSLYVGQKSDAYYFCSESYPLSQLGCESIEQVRRDPFIIDIPTVLSSPLVSDDVQVRQNVIPRFTVQQSEARLLQYTPNNLRRCTRCILPETMPYIRFDQDGICNYCKNYKLRNQPRPIGELFKLVKPYRRPYLNDCIIPFSGGRDSCYGLHLVVKELGLKPITYTYDWGMVTDLGRCNISRMCAKLGVENIIVAANISKKRRYIAKNLSAWLKCPNLGMISILTAGDKHFFRHIETVKKQTGINLNLWGVNPLEVTHFKSGFLGVVPDFEEERVYSHGLSKQLRYQKLRLGAMFQSPGYFNSSLWDTLSGEYYRSFNKKTDYYHIFDYWRWDETVINQTLLTEYDWETAPDTSTTWRIGDGTAAIYNYIYYTVAGFTEHDTFRSNQIREGDITRDQALDLVQIENQPRYTNIKWYLDAIGMDFVDVISVINKIPKLW